MNKKVKGAVIFASGLVGGTIIGSGLVINKILDDKDFRKVISEKICNKIDKVMFGEERVKKHRTISNNMEYRNSELYETVFKVEEISFMTEDSANVALTEMKQIFDQYSLISVQDYYDIAGFGSAHFTASKFGWTTLKNVTVKQNKYGYFIDLPQPIRID